MNHCRDNQDGQNLLPGQTAHIPGLDGLRGIAAIGVFAYHLFPDAVKGGYLGVTLLFTLSGYLAAVTSVRDYDAGKFSAPGFYRKRLRRIYPPLIAVIFLTAGALKLAAPKALNGLRPEVLSIMLGYNNLWQISQNASYFTRLGNTSPFTHLWSLAIEMQFYLIWPLLFMLYQRMRERLARPYASLLVLLPALGSVLWLEVAFRPGEDVTEVYYSTGTRCFSLLLGALLGLKRERKRRKRPLPERTVRRAVCLFAGQMLLLAAVYLLLDGQSDFTYRAGLVGTSLLSCALVKLAADRRLPIGRWLDCKPLTWLGKRSYEIYLWQYPVIFLFRYNKWNRIPGAFAIMAAVVFLLTLWLEEALESARTFPLCDHRAACGTESRPDDKDYHGGCMAKKGKLSVSEREAQ